MVYIHIYIYESNVGFCGGHVYLSVYFYIVQKHVAPEFIVLMSVTISSYFIYHHLVSLTAVFSMIYFVIDDSWENNSKFISRKGIFPFLFAGLMEFYPFLNTSKGKKSCFFSVCIPRQFDEYIFFFTKLYRKQANC